MEHRIIIKISKNLQQNNSETVTSENDKEINKEIPKDTYVYIQKKDRKLLMIWDWYNSIIMEYQIIIKNLLGNTPNQTNKFRTKNWVEINDDARGTYNKDSQIKFKTWMLKSILCD